MKMDNGSIMVEFSYKKAIYDYFIVNRDVAKSL